MKLRNKKTGEIIDVCLAEWGEWEEESEIDEHKNLMIALQDVFKQLHYGDEDMFSRMANVVETGDVYQGVVKITDLHDRTRFFGITINENNKEK